MPLRSGKFFSFNDSESSDSDSVVEQLVPTSRSDIQPIPLTSVSALPMDSKLVQEQSCPADFDMASPAFSSFLKNPSKFVSNVPKLRSDGSNFADWTKGLDNIFMYIFNKILFTDDPNNFDLFPQAKGALRFFLQQTIASDLSEMIQNEASPKLAFVELQQNFKKSTRLMQLDLVFDFFDMYNSVQSLKPNDIFSLNSYLVSVKREDKGESSQSVMKLAPKNQVPMKNRQMENLTNSMAKFVISSSSTPSSKPGATQVKSLRMPYENEIKQAHLNIKLCNRQPLMALRQKHGMECHYCKSQGLAYLGHWISTCPIIREILKLEKAPPSMMGIEPAIRAICDEKTAGLVDTGSQVHVSGNSDLFISMEPLEQMLALNLASPSFCIHATHRGKMKMPFISSEVNDVLFCKEVPGTLLLLGKLVEQGYKVRFVGSDMLVNSPQGELYFYAKFLNRSWIIHPFQSNILIRKGLDSPAKWSSFVCNDCMVAKSMRRQLAAHDEAPREQARDLMMSDVLGPMPILDIHQNKYILTLRDHFSTFVFCFPIKTCDEVPTVLTKTFALIHSVFGKSVKSLRTDNAKEYMGQNFKIILMSMGTQQLFTCPYTPEQNGEAERLNRTLGDAARTMLRASGLLKQFWSYAYKCAAYIHNRIPNSRTGTMTPLELWCGRRPQPKRIFPFGAKAIVHIPIEKRGKLDDRGKLCQLIGFQDDSQGYFFWDDNNKKVLNSNHVKFIDFSTNEQSDKMKITNLLNKLELRLGQENTEGICDEQDNVLSNLTTFMDTEIPTNMTEAKNLNWDKWRAAIERELVSFSEMNVWTPVEKQIGMKTIRTKFVFDLKQKGSPEEIVYKARLVAKGFCQRYGIDCEHTYAPTASLTSLRMLLALSLKNKWKMASFDVSVAYLHSPIKETVYVEAPTQFRPEWQGKVMRLNKAMYGLKQAGYCWWQHFRSVIESVGFKAEELDQCVYKCTRNDAIIYVRMHVDDGVIFSNNESEISRLKADLMHHLKLQWEDTLSRIVGIDLSCSQDRIVLSQSRFAHQVVDQFEKKANITLLRNKTTLPEYKLETSTDKPLEQKWYQSII
ncbi:hypothetical protein O181_063364 [Austropuccinia psidii MF-1]|uniref:Integrase catalytic domain-containing protein n=1 Tax=Austropuccinia psidii MF-1 TaxID=1389203 RepID=A0A9Q3EM07_9BASI|nr:hypothetical protein [Austropuccinia psidii MF-1]